MHAASSVLSPSLSFWLNYRTPAMHPIHDPGHEMPGSRLPRVINFVWWGACSTESGDILHFCTMYGTYSAVQQWTRLEARLGVQRAAVQPERESASRAPASSAPPWLSVADIVDPCRSMMEFSPWRRLKRSALAEEVPS